MFIHNSCVHFVCPHRANETCACDTSVPTSLAVLDGALGLRMAIKFVV